MIQSHSTTKKSAAFNAEKTPVSSDVHFGVARRASRNQNKLPAVFIAAKISQNAPHNQRFNREIGIKTRGAKS